MIVVLADDLSGAAELADAALRHGLSAEVQTEFCAATDADVVCVDTDTRLLPPAEAARLAEIAARAAVAAKPAWIFKKCDSVLRGPVLAEVRAIARAAGMARSVILSANPSRGRVIRAGEYFVEGIPLHETVFAHDPTHPRQSARVRDLLGESDGLSGVGVQPLSENTPPTVETPDATTPADVTRIAAGVDFTTLPVGAADFFAALLAVRVPPRVASATALPARNTSFLPANSPGGPTILSPAVHLMPFPTLLVCGSTASWPQRRAEAEKLGLPVFAFPHDLAAIADALRSPGRALLGIGENPTTQKQTPTALTAKLAQSVVAVLRMVPVARLLLEGGATARAVIHAHGWSRLRACDTTAPGIGALRPPRMPHPLLLIKPGSYPWPSAAWP